MEKNADQLPSNHNLVCHVCRENKFEEREGFYYCLECGTKQEQVRLVEIERNYEFDSENVKSRKQKIDAPKPEKPQLTSWECYNYILRGFVEELLLLGAKEELKLMALQVWAAYLRRMEAAFFSRKQHVLPKLGIKYLRNDAQTIYNHSQKNKKRRQRRRSVDTSTDGAESRSARSWSRTKRNLDESHYSLTSASSLALTSSTSTNSNRAIKIDFNTKARAFFKKRMNVKHLEKHQIDAEGLLKCHKQPRVRDINRSEYHLMLVNIKQVYSVLAIALNLIGDEIQLCDLVRFINEGHIGKANVLQYFPENIANNGKEILYNIKFHKCPEKYSDKFLRDHIGIICKNIGIYVLNKPDLIKLVRRYVMDLCLPTEFAVYIDRLINLLPPNFNRRSVVYPGYEARAMAYIIFALKLFFGLDDTKEKRISRASKNLNSKIELMNLKSYTKQPLLFVWSEWVEYIEVRKAIVSQFSMPFCEQFEQHQSKNQVLEQLAKELRRNEERDNLLNDTSENMEFKNRLQNFRSIFERFSETYKASAEGNTPLAKIEFKPTLTPALSYMKNVLLICDREANASFSKNIKIPDFMRIDHSERDISSYLQVKPLTEYFKTNQTKLNVHVIAAKENRKYIGIFRPPRKFKSAHNIFNEACFDVTEEEWIETIKKGFNKEADDLEFCTDFKSYAVISNCRERKNHELSMMQDKPNNKKGKERMPKAKLPGPISCQSENEVQKKLESMYSFEVFSENNMKPVDCNKFVLKPRRNLENIDLFEGISDEESLLNNDDGEDVNISDDSVSDTLNENDSLLYSEEFVSIKQNSSNPSEIPASKKKQDTTNNDLKMYISNMDCWVILGFLNKTTRDQRIQLQDKFPRSFNWLLETCAQTINVEWSAVFEQLLCIETINVEWSAVFEQLLCIETMFCLGIKDPKTIKNCVYMDSDHSNIDTQMLINTYREMW